MSQQRFRCTHGNSLRAGACGLLEQSDSNSIMGSSSELLHPLPYVLSVYVGMYFMLFLPNANLRRSYALKMSYFLVVLRSKLSLERPFWVMNLRL